MKSIKLNKLRFAFTCSIGIASLYIIGCATNSSTPSTSIYSPAIGSAVESVNRKSVSLTSAPAPSAKTKSLKPERPGLGTGWGEDLASSVNYTNFQRASKQPTAISSIYYNDKEGIKAMTSRFSSKGKGLEETPNGMIAWGVKGNWGYLNNRHSNGKRFVTGNKNSNYTLVVKNLTQSRLEIVLSVDGIDVLDGKPASTRKRGYIVQPGKTLKIKGFRKSADAVAAFKFASVNSSYSNLSGKGTRNVGVIGLAVFTEKGIDPWKYGTIERKKRANASPFAEAPQLRAR